jgi:DNA-binding LacI/PurR family transcriptional regulator
MLCKTAARTIQIDMDQLKSHKAFASAKQVAELAGVSRSAVSRAFTPGASISEDKRRRILAASEELGYHVNHLARGLLRSSGIVCLIVATATPPISHVSCAR